MLGVAERIQRTKMSWMYGTRTDKIKIVGIGFAVVAVIIGAVVGIIAGVRKWKQHAQDRFLPDIVEEPTVENANTLTAYSDYNNAEAMYKRLIRENNDPEAYYHLAEMYYFRAQGDRDPILLKALKHYKRAVSMGYIDGLIKIADIHNFCTLEGEGIPNKDVARALYSEIVKSKNTKPDVRREANIKLTDLNREFQLKNVNRAPRLRPQEPNAVIIREHQIPIGPVPGVRIRRVRNPTRGIRNDSQNVHDNTLQKDFTKSIKKLKKLNRYNQNVIPSKDIIPAVRNMILEMTQTSRQDRENAMASLDTIEKVNSGITNAMGFNEQDILGLVWNRIYHQENIKNRDGLKRSLYNQLADASVNGKAVCATGRATRVLQTLQLTDADKNLVQLRPKWALKEELANNAGKIRKRILDGYTPREVDVYINDDTSSHENELIVRNVTKKIKDNIRQKAHEDYVETGLMTKKEVDEELAPILDAV